MTYSVKQIVERYGVSQATVLHWLATKQLMCINVGRDPGKKRARYRVTEKQLADFESTRTPVPPAPKARRRKQSADIIEFIK